MALLSPLFSFGLASLDGFFGIFSEFPLGNGNAPSSAIKVSRTGMVYMEYAYFGMKTGRN